MQSQGYSLRSGALHLFGGSLAGRGLSFLLNTGTQSNPWARQLRIVL